MRLCQRRHRDHQRENQPKHPRPRIREKQHGQLYQHREGQTVGDDSERGYARPAAVGHVTWRPPGQADIGKHQEQIKKKQHA